MQTQADFDFMCLVLYGSLDPSCQVEAAPKPMEEIAREAREIGRPLALHLCNGDHP